MLALALCILLSKVWPLLQLVILLLAASLGIGSYLGAALAFGLANAWPALGRAALGAGGVFGSAFTFLGFLGGLAAAGFVILLGEGIVQATLCRRSLRKNGCNKGLKSSNWDFLGGWWSYPWAPQKFKI